MAKDNDLDKAKAFKELGNKAFKECNYLSAFLLYKVGLSFIPPNWTDDIAIFHYNLGLTCLNLMQHKDAIK